MRWLRVYVCLRKAFLSASPEVVDCTNFFTLKSCITLCERELKTYLQTRMDSCGNSVLLVLLLNPFYTGQ